MKTAAVASSVAAFVLIAVKLFASAMTDSVAMLSSLIDSSLDAGASLISLWAVRTSLVPADSDHRFGHGKVEALAALGQAAFISGSAVLLIFQSIQCLLRPRRIDHVDIGIGVMLFSVVVTLLLIAFQRYVIKKTGSVAITADRAHYAGDILMNLSVMASLGLGVYFDSAYIDPAFALCIAAYLIISAFRVVKKAMGQLIDAELPADEKRKIADIVLNAPEVSGMHDLRTRSAGIKWFIQMNLELDPNFTLAKAHAVADNVEKLLMKAFPNAEIIIHQDPAGLNEHHPQWCYEQP
ncbi:MAG: cation diffusion facilitator family transporter [Alphaproteobacteria bacterium]|nr:cation diffusion facilitator family transporter [Alphaproteobacteria bacterium]MBO4644522.1 cation diffusion facilitator family transporter [Alphaproteobacteria bacterium]